MLMVVLWLYIREQCVFWINLDGSSVLDGYVLNQDGNGVKVMCYGRMLSVWTIINYNLDGGGIIVMYMYYKCFHFTCVSKYMFQR